MPPEPTPDSARPDTHVSPRVYATPDLAPVGGVIKQRPEDFLVDEIPLYQPAGAGEHIYLLIQKRLMSTMDMVNVVARHFKVSRGAVGYAGLKDKHAITRQVVSVHVPGKKLDDFPMLQHDQLSVLWTDMHANKLRPGHLKGNRFSIRIRNVKPTDVVIANKVLQRLVSTGVPNRVGEQRFGMLENNHLVGRHMIAGDYDAAVRELLGPNQRFPQYNTDARRLFLEGRFKEAIQLYPPGARTEMIVLNALSKGNRPKYAMMALDEPVLRYYLSAFQSAVFNAVLDDRLERGEFSKLVPGDVAVKHANGAAFAITDEIASDPTTPQRLATFEISPSGPMWGGGMLRAQGEVGTRELAALAPYAITEDRLTAFDMHSRGALDGKRRPLRVPLTDPEVEGGVDEHGPYIRCAFELPRGSFATVVLREIMKPQAGQSLPDEE